MKKLVLLSLSVLFVAGLIGCKKGDPLEKHNRVPVVLLEPIVENNQGSETFFEEIRDSLKLEFEYRLRFHIGDEEKLRLEYDCFSEHKDYTLNIQQSAGDTLGFITFKADRKGVFEFDLFAKDSYKKRGVAKLRIVAFENKPPVAVVTITKVGNLSPYEIRIDATQSYDPDEKFGGGITRYKYQIGENYEVETTERILNYILPGPGTRTVKVRVKDNQGAWSAEFVQQVQF